MKRTIAVIALFATEALAQPLAGKSNLASGVSIVVNRGANIGVSRGRDGLVLVDEVDMLGLREIARPSPPSDSTAAEKVLLEARDAYVHGQYEKAIEIAKQAVLGPDKELWVIVTHWHPDQSLALTSLKHSIVVHENAQRRMNVAKILIGGRPYARSLAKPPPADVFSDQRTLHLNGDEIRVFHVPNAHSDGDAIVHFKKADIVFVGDTFVNGAYPMIDVDNGGTIEGYISAQRRVLALAGPRTRIVPGHGAIGDRAALQASYQMIVQARRAIATVAASADTVEDVIAARPTAPWDDKWGGGAVSPEAFITMVYQSLPRD